MQYLLVAMQIIGWFIEHKDELVKLIKGVESLIPDAPGNEKAAAVRNVIATALSIESTIDKAWPMVAPIFNLFVKDVKSPPSLTPKT